MSLIPQNHTEALRRGSFLGPGCERFGLRFGMVLEVICSGPCERGLAGGVTFSIVPAAWCACSCPVIGRRLSPDWQAGFLSPVIRSAVRVRVGCRCLRVPVLSPPSLEHGSNDKDNFKFSGHGREWGGFDGKECPASHFIRANPRVPLGFLFCSLRGLVVNQHLPSGVRHVPL